MSLCSSLWLCAAQLLVHEHTRLLSASTNPLHVWDPKRRLFLQLIPLRKALVKMNEPPPAWGPAEKAPLPPWKRLHILSVSHHQSCIFGAACSITEHQTPATICNRQHSFHAHSRQIRVHCPKRCATESDITGTGSLSVRSTRDWRKSKNEEKRGFLEFRKQQRRRKKWQNLITAALIIWWNRRIWIPTSELWVQICIQYFKYFCNLQVRCFL